MNKKNTMMLFKKFPSLFKKENLPFGFEVDDGWYKLIHDLSEKLVKSSPNCEASQVKEKFGGLRFYVYNCNEKGHKLISKAEDESYKICEECGKLGKPRTDLFWVKTLCEKHYNEKVDPEYLLKKRKNKVI